MAPLQKTLTSPADAIGFLHGSRDSGGSSKDSCDTDDFVMVPAQFPGQGSGERGGLGVGSYTWLGHSRLLPCPTPLSSGPSSLPDPAWSMSVASYLGSVWPCHNSRVAGRQPETGWSHHSGSQALRGLGWLGLWVPGYLATPELVRADEGCCPRGALGPVCTCFSQPALCCQCTA